MKSILGILSVLFFLAMTIAFTACYFELNQAIDCNVLSGHVVFTTPCVLHYYDEKGLHVKHFPITEANKNE